MIRSVILTAAAALALAGCAVSEPPSASGPPVAAAPATPAPVPASGTAVLDEAAAVRLLGANGVTLQWIGWDERGPIRVRSVGGTILLTGSQQQRGGPGRLFLDGEVREIGADYFVFDGLIRITDSPDPGRNCEADKPWRFAITQARAYWRLREFEWCDGLTDYIDIYF